MSTPGSPGGAAKFSKPSPPERGSFPLDHDAECQPLMKAYLRCIKGQKGVPSDECRELSSGYLTCRMERNLMAPDTLRNLGFEDMEARKREGRGEDASSAQDKGSSSSGK